MASLLALPLLTLHLTDRCNSRCISCDYWRHGRVNITPDSVRALLPGLKELGTRTILVSGGEPLINPDWPEIAELLRASGLELWLLTSGLSLAKHAAKVARLFQSVTVSLDGTDPESYRAIRGVDAFDVVCEGIRAVAAAGIPVSVRVTVQRANYRDLNRFVTLTRELGAHQVSFLAADVSNNTAFGRQSGETPDIALRSEDLPIFQATLDTLVRDRKAEFASGFIAESPIKLRRLLNYYRAICGLGDFPEVRCNAPEFSAVVETDGRVRPCFFIPGAANAKIETNLSAALNAPAMSELRADIRAGRRPECATCVCSMWRDPKSFARQEFKLGARKAANGGA
jgi:MoaA/NifB/PqqE/SkfB family radical SAM enzyme